MAKKRYQLSKAVEKDLLEIARFGDKQFGITQSNRYRDKLSARFVLIAHQPLLFPSVSHIREGYRRSVCGAHAIYYRLTAPDTVEIVRVLGMQNIESSF